jgi:hypothetical protein
MEMSEILSDKEPEKVEAPVAPSEPEVKAEPVEEAPQSKRKAHQAREWAEQGRDPETGQFVPKEEKKEEPKVEAKVETKPEPKKEEFTEKERAFLKGLEEERRKRQELERKLAEIEKKTPQEKKEEKTFWDDPEGHFKSFEQRMAQRETAIALNVSEKIARSKYTDFDEKVGEFAESLKNTPGLHAQWLSSPDPAEFAYRHGQRVKEMREVGDLDKYREKIEKETRAKLEAEFRAKQEEFEKQKSSLPPSLSDVKGAVKQHQPVFKGPTPLEDIFKR